MAVAIHSLAHNDDLGEHRRAIAVRVVERFESALQRIRIVVILDAYDWPELKEDAEENRGAFYPTVSNEMNTVPGHFQHLLIALDQPDSPQWTCDGFIYLHNSTCATDVGLSMTLAHELQHAVQFATKRIVWAFNWIVTYMPRESVAGLGLRWRDLPVEHEARIVSKGLCEELLGREATDAYIAERIAAGTIERDTDDWRFIQGIETQSENVYDLASETGKLFRQLRKKAPGYLEIAVSRAQCVSGFPEINLEDAFALGAIIRA